MTLRSPGMQCTTPPDYVDVLVIGEASTLELFPTDRAVCCAHTRCAGLLSHACARMTQRMAASLPMNNSFNNSLRYFQFSVLSRQLGAPRGSWPHNVISNELVARTLSSNTCLENAAAYLLYVVLCVTWHEVLTVECLRALISDGS